MALRHWLLLALVLTASAGAAVRAIGGLGGRGPGKTRPK